MNGGTDQLDLKLHHVGVLVADIPTHAELYVRRYGYQLRSPVLHDPLQTAFVQFLALPGDVVYLEFVASDGPGSKLANALNRGGGLNHLCYSTARIQNACECLSASGMLLLKPPVAAVAFAGRKVAWLMGKDVVPIELVERGPGGEL